MRFIFTLGTLCKGWLWIRPCQIIITQTGGLKCYCAVDFDSCVTLAFYLYHVLFHHHLLSFLASVLLQNKNNFYCYSNGSSATYESRNLMTSLGCSFWFCIALIYVSCITNLLLHHSRPHAVFFNSPSVITDRNPYFMNSA